MKGEIGPEPLDASGRHAWAVFLLGAVLGGAFFAHYFGAGLTIAHYDAKAHLVVSRRIVDSLEPGYVQLGAHWLPLVHVLYLPFVIFDAQYHSGFLPSLLSVLAFAFSGFLAFRIVHRATRLASAGWFSAILLLANPNLLYLQSCPLTEPLAMVLLLASVDALAAWRERGAEGLPWLAALFSATGALCRYEGWVFVGGMVLLLAVDVLWKRVSFASAARAALCILAFSLVPLLAHFGYVYSRLRDNFLIRVAHGNPAPYETFHRPVLSLTYHAAEVLQIASVLAVAIGVAGVVFCLSRGDRLRSWLPLFLLWTPSTINIAALYWGHIYRVRYSVLLLPAIAVFGGLLAGSSQALRRTLAAVAVLASALPWLAWYFPHEWKYHGVQAGPGVLILPVCALVAFCAATAFARCRVWALMALAVAGMHVPVLSGEVKPIVAETMEHEFIEPERAQVLEALREGYDSTRILIDMGKLAPLVFDSRLPVREFVYNEGFRRGWVTALRSPASQVGWICVERGDEISGALQIDPKLTDGYAPAVQTDNLLLFRLIPERRGLLRTTGRIE